MKLKQTIAVLILSLFLSPVLLAKSLVIGVEKSNSLPYFKYNGGEYSGFFNELLQAFAKSKDYTITYKAYPVARLLGTMMRNEIDCKIPDNKYWGSDQKGSAKIMYSTKITTFIDAVLSKPEFAKSEKGSIKIATITGFFTPDLGTISRTTTPMQLMQQLSNNRIKGAFFNVKVAQKLYKEVTQSDEEIIVNENFEKLVSDISLSCLNNDTVINDFNSFLEENQSVVSTLKGKYGL